MGRPSKIDLGSKKYPDDVENLRTDYVSQSDTNAQAIVSPITIRGLPIDWVLMANALPIFFGFNTQVTKTYENGYIKLVTVAGQYPAVTSGRSIQRKDVLSASAKGYAPNDKDIFWFFFEPYKGNITNFQGFRTTSVYYAMSCGAGTTQTQLSNQDWTVPTQFTLHHWENQSKVEFLIDGAVVATHTTNISAQPYEICGFEPAGVACTLYLKYPPGFAHYYYTEEIG